MADGSRAWAATRLGLVRTANEDRWRVGDLGGDGADADWVGLFSDHRPWALVADGMGGHGAGEIASSVALEAICHTLEQHGPSDLRSSISEANHAVFEAMDRPLGRSAMGTTVAGVCKQGTGLTVFNVGDSRVYLLREGRLEMLSIDHTLPRRGGERSHALTQSLGGTSVPVPLFPHLAVVQPAAGDVILLCTDGLTDMLDENVLSARLTDTASNPAAGLADAAVEAGGRDNVTVVVLSF